MLPYAGYVRIDDVTATAYNTQSLLDIANNRNINEGNTIWLGYTDNGDWDVLRYTKINARVVDAAIQVPGSTVLLTTDNYHNVNPGDTISITQFENNIEFKVKDNGIGLPQNYNKDKSNSIGFDLIYGLSEQLDGNITINTNNGTEFIIKFKKLENI